MATQNNNTPLFISAGFSQKSAPLYIANAFQQHAVNLMLQGGATQASGMPLVMFADDGPASGIPLFIDGKPHVVSGVMTLFLQSSGVHFSNAAANLFIQGVGARVKNNKLCLTINSAAPTGSLPLHIWGSHPNNPGKYKSDKDNSGFVPITDTITIYINGS